MYKLIHENELCTSLGVTRQTVWKWRVEGMPFMHAASGSFRFRYLYDPETVKAWAKKHGKRGVTNK